MIELCLLLMLFVLIKTINEKSISPRGKRNFILCLSFAIVMLITDGISLLKINKTIEIPIWANYLDQIIYFISTSICCYFTLLLIDCLGDKPLIKEKRTKLLLSIPLYIYGIFVITSIWSGWIFSINSDNVYIRGPLNFFQFIFSYSYLFVALGIAFYKFKRGKIDANKDIYLANILFCLIPTLGGFIQFGVSIAADIDLPLISAGLALSSVIIFTELIQNQVSIDSLTGLPSRKFFYKYLYSINKNNVTHLYVFMIDLNKFKNINDEYGHLEGDRALEVFAQALRIQTRKRKGVCARLGGDEFAIAVELLNNNPEEYLDYLKEEINKINDQNDFSYEIKAAIGYAELEDDDTIQALMKKADDKMYYDKINN